MSSCNDSNKLHGASTHAAQVQQRLIGSTLQKKQLCFKGICAVELVTLECIFAGK